MAREKIPVLVIGDAVAPTGFGRVMHGIFENLPRGKYDVHHLGINYRGDPHSYKAKIYPAMVAGGQGMFDVYGISRIQELLDKVQPKIVFVLNDIWVLPMYLAELRRFKDRGFKVITYSPVDARPIEWRWLTDFRDVDRVTVYTEFGKDVVEASIKSWEAFLERNPHVEDEVQFPKLAVIPHGVDGKTFYPYKDIEDRSGNLVLQGKINAKRKTYPNEEDFINSFIVLNANRNQPRKRIDLTMEGFAKFARDKPDNVKLYLHMGVEDMGWNIIWLSERLGIDNRLIITSNSPNMPGVSDDKMNEIYNACDVGINTSVGEGWGLVSFEHAATRTAQIVPRHSCQEEIWGDSADYADIEKWYVSEKIMTEGGYISTDSLANSLQKLYDDPQYLNDMAEKAYQVTKKPEHTWKSVAKKFDKLFMEVLNEQ